MMYFILPPGELKLYCVIFSRKYKRARFHWPLVPAANLTEAKIIIGHKRPQFGGAWPNVCSQPLVNLWHQKPAYDETFFNIFS
jgi:hypothetical protein